MLNTIEILKKLHPTEIYFLQSFNNFSTEYILDDDIGKSSWIEKIITSDDLLKYLDLSYCLNEQGIKINKELNKIKMENNVFNVQETRYFKVLNFQSNFVNDAVQIRSSRPYKMYLKNNIDSSLIDMVMESCSTFVDNKSDVLNNWKWRNYNTGGSM